jgi:hypothetical protein
MRGDRFAREATGDTLGQAEQRGKSGRIVGAAPRAVKANRLVASMAKAAAEHGLRINADCRVIDNSSLMPADER